MKPLLLLGLAAAALGGCAGLPAPQHQGDSLVIGSLILDFPDGFFGWAPRKIDRQVLLIVSDTTTKKDFTLSTSSGYFRFLGNGTDEYVLKSCRFSTMEGGDRYVLAERPLGLRITSAPGKVVYVGHTVVTYRKTGSPRERGLSAQDILHGDYQVAGRRMDQVGLPLREETILWNYQVSVDRTWDQAELQQFLRERGTGSPWLEREIEKEELSLKG